MKPTGMVVGETPRERAVAAAGVLAELGVARLVLRAGGGEVELAARRTDLPGELVRAGRGELIAASIGVCLEFDESGARWRALGGQQV